jgi:Putative stress-induced transcription regulator
MTNEDGARLAESTRWHLGGARPPGRRLPPGPDGRARTGYYQIVADPDFSAVSAGDSAAAPGGQHLIQSLARTLRPDQDSDLLASREDATAWLRKAALLPADAGLSNSEHAAVLRLRDSIRDVLAAHAAGRGDEAAGARLTKALADGRLVLTVGPAGAPRLASAARASYPNLVAAVAIAIAESGEWPGGG